MSVLHIAYFVAGIVVGAVIMSFAPSTGVFVLGRDRVAGGEAFSAELIPDGSGIRFCGCLHGNIARYLIEHGPNVGGPMCLNCARAEFVAWCLQQCDKRLTRHAEDLDLVAVELNPDPNPDVMVFGTAQLPLPAKRVQP
jgi:hypothetical protein